MATRYRETDGQRAASFFSFFYFYALPPLSLTHWLSQRAVSMKCLDLVIAYLHFYKALTGSVSMNLALVKKTKKSLSVSLGTRFVLHFTTL